MAASHIPRASPWRALDLHAHHASLGEAGQLDGALFLARAFDTEAFETERGAFIPAASASLLKEFKGLFLATLTEAPEQRKQLRPLLDAVERAGYA